MTCIVSPSQFASKAKLQALLNAGANVPIFDPSVFAPRSFLASSMTVGQSEIVTNHPIRSEFAKIVRTAAGFRVL